VSLRSVQRICGNHRLQPHRVRRFKLSQDLASATKLSDGLRRLGCFPSRVGHLHFSFADGYLVFVGLSVNLED
jgi:hypothetical protein